MTTWQKILISTVLVVATGVGFYEARRVSNLQKKSQSPREQSPWTEQIQKLQLEREDFAQQLAALREENERLNRNTSELLKLRGEVGVLKKAREQTSTTPETASNLAVTLPISERSISDIESRRILVPALLKESGLNTPQSTVETYLWTQREASDPSTNERATEKLRELSWFPPGFDPLKYKYAHPENYENPFTETKFLKIESVIYTDTHHARVLVNNYSDLGYRKGTEYELIRENSLWKVRAPVRP